jgi:hypothetical protein
LNHSGHILKLAEIITCFYDIKKLEIKIGGAPLMKKKLILKSCILVLLCFVVTSLARAGGEKAAAIIWVADTRNLTGIWKWFAAMYNEAPLIHAIWVIIITAVQGILLGFGMDWIMQWTGLELEERELRE